MAKEQARLHEKFDELVASSALDHYICKVSSSMVGTMPYVYMFLQIYCLCLINLSFEVSRMMH
jgi:hypothetical protein